MSVDPFTKKTKDPKPIGEIEFSKDVVETLDRNWVLRKLVQLVEDCESGWNDNNATATLSPRATALSRILDIIQMEDTNVKKDSYSEDDLERLEVLLEAGKIDG